MLSDEQCFKDNYERSYEEAIQAKNNSNYQLAKDKFNEAADYLEKLILISSGEEKRKYKIRLVRIKNMAKSFDKKIGGNMGVKDSIYIKSAALIADDTLFNVAMCKLNGIGMEKNEEEATELLKILASRGFVPAIKPLVDYYRRIGENELADKWLVLGKDNGDIASKIDYYLRNEVKEDNLRNDSLIFNPSNNNSNQTRTNTNSIEEVVKKALPHVVMIYAPSDRPGFKSTGSGFILDGGIVITNEHVVGKNPHNVTCVFEPSIDNNEYNLIPIAISDKYDLAILVFEGRMREKMENMEHLKLRTGDLNFAEQVITIGSPLGLGLSVSHGIVSNPKCTSTQGGWPYVIQSDMSINHGNSGGALLDMNGNVVGVSTFIMKQGNGGLSFASPTVCLIEFINKTFR